MNPKVKNPRDSGSLNPAATNLRAFHILRESLNATVEKLISEVGAALAAIPQQSTPSVPTPAVVYFDFARQQMVRPGIAPRKLANALHIRILERLFRRPRLSVVSFLLIPRGKLSGKPSVACDPSAAKRTEMKRLRDWIEDGALHIQIEGLKQNGDGRVKVRFDRTQIGSNIMEAAGVAAEASCQRSSDSCGAVALAVHALTVDPDSGLAAAVLFEIAKHDPNRLTRNDILRWEIYEARAILRTTATLLRLNGPGLQTNADAEKARQLATRLFHRLFRRWQIFQSLAFGESVSSHAGGDPHRHLLNAIVRVSGSAVSRLHSPTCMNNAPNDAKDASNVEAGAAHALFTSDPVIHDMAEQLLARRLTHPSPQLQEKAVQSVMTQICSALLFNGILPASMALQSFKDEFITAYKRRLDWEFLDRSRRRGASFRDDLYRNDDADEEDMSDNECDD